MWAQEAGPPCEKEAWPLATTATAFITTTPAAATRAAGAVTAVVAVIFAAFAAFTQVTRRQQ